MKQNPEHILEILKKIHLTAEEKASMRFRIVTQIEQRAQKLPKYTATPDYKSPFFFPHLALGRRALAGVVTILLIASTGVSFAAEGTLPGDILYPVKIHVTEEVRGALTVGSTAKVKWEKDRVVKRVVETEKLIKNKALTPARKVQAEAAIKQQIQNFSNVATSEKLNPVAVIDATSDLEPTLKAHQEVLLALSDTQTADDTSTQGIIDSVEEGIKIAGAQESAALDSVNTISTGDLTTAVDTKITDTEKEIATLTATDTDIATKDAEDKALTAEIKDIETKAEATTDTKTTTQTSTKPVQDPTVPPQKTTEQQPDTTPTLKSVAVEPKISAQLKIEIAPVSSLTTSTTVLETTDVKKVDSKEEKIALQTVQKTQRRREVIANAKATLELANQKRSKGELSEALRLAQQAYKSVLEINVGTQLSKEAEQDALKNIPSETTDAKKDTEKDSIISTATNTKDNTTSETTTKEATTDTTKPLEIKPDALKAQVIPLTQ